MSKNTYTYHDEAKLTTENFPEIEAYPNRFLTWFFRILSVGLIGTSLLLLLFLPVAFALDKSYQDERLTLVVVSCLFYAVSLPLLYRAWRYIKSRKGHAVVHIRVDQTGIHYTMADGSASYLLYSDLRKSKDRYWEDVFAQTQGRWGPTVLQVWVDKTPRTVNFMTDIGYAYYVGNQLTLKAHFIRGIRLFRTDLHVGPSVFSLLYIDPVTYELDIRERRKTFIGATILLMIILIGIEAYIYYRHGYTLIFNF
ncbi:MAG: hypothetical protein M3421_11110 [Bacteroidota bacterium]|nr:hypothetical protein [Bacteroidota bacterium]